MKNENQSDMKISQPRLGKGGMIALITACVSRPFATTILLNLQRQDSGSASALINFTFTLAGAVGMLMIHTKALSKRNVIKVWPPERRVK